MTFVPPSTGVGRPPGMQTPTQTDILTEKYLRDAAGQYVDFTPVLTGTSGGFAYGTGNYQIGRFKRIGSQCHYIFKIYFGNPGFVAGGNTVWHISIPILPFIEQFPQLWDNVIPAGCVFINDGAGSTSQLVAPLLVPNDKTMTLIVPGVAGSPTQRVTGTSLLWATGASIEGSFVYEVSG